MVKIESMNNRESPSQIVSSFPRWRYEVFISFRGEDTRKNFTDHLYAALKGKGIIVFKDDKEIEKGKSISPELYKAIEESRISIIVFSENYAFSTWCLDELVKILQCMKMKKQIVIPIFYDVDPSMVRKQIEKFEEAFAKHEEAFKEDIERVQNWRTALIEVANISGWDLKDRHESEFIQDIVDQISSKLSPAIIRNHESNLVGIRQRSKEVMKLLIPSKSNDVRMIGIYGIGGMGKTTISKVVYENIFYQFEARSFLANVREKSKEKNGMSSLQKQLLCDILNIEGNSNIRNANEKLRSRLWHNKVLIVLDDVDNINQLNELAGKHDWFGLGSRIIITTRDKHLLEAHRVDHAYELEALDDCEALQLFNLKAFKNSIPSKEYSELSQCVVKYAGGLPLALNVLGSFLFGRTVDEWKSALKRLDQDSERSILECLQISFDGLEETEKKIFLDVACFFKGKKKNHVIRILDGCDFNPTIGVRVLQDKCLLTISENNTLWMHDLLQKMGQQIVKKESIVEPGKRSRLWKKRDVLHVLTKNTGTELIEGIILEEEMQLSGNVEAFLKMTNLRLLKLHNKQLSKGLKNLSSELRLLEWHRYALKSLPSSLKLDNIVEIIMHYSCIVQLWGEIEPLSKLKVISLSHSKNLKKTPDFTKVPNLEKLILEGCTGLCEIHPSLAIHKKLTLLNLIDCNNLTSLPIYIEDLKSLKTLKLSTELVEKVPENTWQIESLEELDIRGTATREPKSNPWYSHFPFSLMSRKDSAPMTLTLTSLSGLCSLKRLNLRDCCLKAIPRDIGNLVSLELLDLSGNDFVSLPVSMNRLSRLRNIYLKNCKMLQSLPELQSTLCIVGLRNCASLETLSNAKKSHQFSYFDCVVFFRFRHYIHPGRENDLIEDLLEPSRPFNNRGILYGTLIPASEVLKFFMHQSEGSSIRIKSDGQKKIRGYFVCAVFSVHKAQPGLHKYRHFFLSSVFKDSKDSRNWHYSIIIQVSDEGMPDHLLLWYYPIHKFGGQSHDVEVKFELIESNPPGFEWKKCGFHPKYEEVDTFDHQMEECRSSINGNLIEYHQDSTTPTKRGFTDEAGPSGGGNSDNDEPQHKRQK